MDRVMDALEVYCSEGQMIVIKQDSAMAQETSFVVVHPDQVDTLVRWLTAAKAELLTENVAR